MDAQLIEATEIAMELDQIEELEQKIAPDGGETVLPLVRPNRRRSEW